MARDFSKMKPEELEAIYQANFGANKQAQQPQSPQGQPDLQAVLSQLNASGLMPQKSNPIAQGLMDFGSVIQGKDINTQQADFGGDLAKVAAQGVIKKRLEDPIDKQINRDYKVAATKYREAGLEGSPVARTSDITQQRNLDFKTSQDLKNRAFDFRKEFLGQKPVEQFHEMIGKGRQIDEVLTKYLTEKYSGADPKSVQFTDQALITLLNKILDPLSVVRESEYARSQEGQNLLNRFSGKIDQMLKQGGAGLTDQDRIELARVAQTLVNGAGETFNQFYDTGMQSSQQWGLDPNLVMSGYTRYSPMEIKDYSNYLQPSQPVQGVESSQLNQQTPVVGQMFNGKPIKAVRKIR